MINHKLVLPQYLNHYGFLFGGHLLKWVDEYAYIAASMEYPDCDFVSWDMPIDEKCKECDSMMSLRRRSNGKSYKKCSNPECVTNQRKKTEEKTDEE